MVKPSVRRERREESTGSWISEVLPKQLSPAGSTPESPPAASRDIPPEIPSRANTHPNIFYVTPTVQFKNNVSTEITPEFQPKANKHRDDITPNLQLNANRHTNARPKCRFQGSTSIKTNNFYVTPKFRPIAIMQAANTPREYSQTFHDDDSIEEIESIKVDDSFGNSKEKPNIKTTKTAWALPESRQIKGVFAENTENATPIVQIDAGQTKRSTQDTRQTQRSPQDTRQTQRSPQDTRQTQRSPQDTRQTQRSPQDTRQTQRSPQDTRQTQRSPQDTRQTQRSPQDTRLTQRSLQDTRQTQRSLQDTRQTQRSPQDTRQTQRSLQDTRQTQRSPQDTRQTQRSPQDAGETPLADKSKNRNASPIPDDAESSGCCGRKGNWLMRVFRRVKARFR